MDRQLCESVRVFIDVVKLGLGVGKFELLASTLLVQVDLVLNQTLQVKLVELLLVYKTFVLLGLHSEKEQVFLEDLSE